MKKITAIIPTFNEEAHIEQAINSVSWADEIIVVDSFSTDQTPQLVANFPQVRFIQHEYVNSATQKNWIIPQAAYAWIFLLDADERPTQTLKNEIDNWRSKEDDYDAYWIKRQNFFLGKKLNFIWKGDAVVRLFKRDTCRYEDLAVHSEIQTSGKIGNLKGKLEHHSFLNLEHYQHKMERYAQWSASDYEQKTNHVGFYHLWIKPAYRFFKHYILELGILDGRAGWTISKFMAWGVRRRYQIILEKRSNDL